MAKDKAGKRAKADKTGPKIPKHIAGVKIPKSLRDSGKAAIKLAQNPMARELLAAGLVAAASAVALKSQAKRRDETKAKPAGAADSVNENIADIGAALVGVAGAAAQRFFKAKRADKSAADGETDKPMGAPDANGMEDADQVGPGAVARVTDGIADAPEAVRPPVPPRRKAAAATAIPPNGKA